jgi:hypothetical protein
MTYRGSGNVTVADPGEIADSRQLRRQDRLIEVVAKP